jgi:lipopolysaccharide export system permease protein
MQVVWLYIDDLIGKGLEWYIIAEYLYYTALTIVPMALPIAILLSSLMTFGNLGEHYELVAIKSAGISLWKTMRPLIILTVFISAGAFFFSDNVLPYVVLKQKSLFYDIKHTKLSFNIKEGEFYHDIDGYVLRVARKSKDNEILYDILIYDHTGEKGATKVTIAERGTMLMSEDGNTIILHLFDGSNYEEGDRKKSNTQDSRPMQRIYFEEQVMHFDISGFEMSRSDGDLFKSNYAMLDLEQLTYAIDSLGRRLHDREEELYVTQTSAYSVLKSDLPENRQDSTIVAKEDTISAIEKAQDIQEHVAIEAKKPLDGLSIKKQKEIVSTAIRNTRSMKQSVEYYNAAIASQKGNIVKHQIVRHEKFTLSFACLILFLIGAPLGSIIRKGGLGLPTVVALLLYVIYHVTSMIGKKYVLAAALPVWIGMWVAAFLLLPLGIFLSMKANNDSPLLDFDSWKKTLNHFIRFKKK